MAQDAPRIEAYTRGRRGWRFEEVEGLNAALALEAFGIELPLAEIYDGLLLPGAGRGPNHACHFDRLICVPHGGLRLSHGCRRPWRRRSVCR